ncbi:ESPR domain-containing protein, partial [Stenotrophomonas panacihumi]|uniref:ESPR domain-containing protein n=1 Tax=Stenotrophomonas panacihumi TaxID=676599 RepID=UPI003CCCA504
MCRPCEGPIAPAWPHIISQGNIAMNRIYRIVWNAATCRWVVASEMAKGRRKKSAGSSAATAAAVTLFSMGVGGPVVIDSAQAFGFCNLLVGNCTTSGAGGGGGWLTMLPRSTTGWGGATRGCGTAPLARCAAPP